MIDMKNQITWWWAIYYKSCAYGYLKGFVTEGHGRKVVKVGRGRGREKEVSIPNFSTLVKAGSAEFEMCDFFSTRITKKEMIIYSCQKLKVVADKDDEGVEKGRMGFGNVVVAAAVAAAGDEDDEDDAWREGQIGGGGIVGAEEGDGIAVAGKLMVVTSWTTAAGTDAEREAAGVR
jgi:hypothetical protein